MIVALHRPPFCSNPRDGIDKELAQTWHPLFVKYEFDFVMTGHVHYYERMCAVENNTACSTTRDRPIYIADGTAGAEFSPASGTPKDAITEYKDFSKWGYSRFFVTDESLNFTHYHVDNSVADSVALPRKRHRK